ncbi:MAG: hypothetical protein ISR75_00455 [Phycisphaerales bacterium]|nr:hypothetical protein [Planctomycetota bacterium]MBL6996893.1 hypothetical protein [Phycisphaerales bacterium]
MFKLCVTTISVICCTQTFATTYTVDDDGTADYSDIQSAINVAVDGDEILVMPGTYTSTTGEVVLLNNGKTIWLHSSEGSDVTFIDGENASRRGITFNGPTPGVVVEGFTIQNCYTAGGGAGSLMGKGASPTLKDCVITNNNAGHGGGVTIGNSGSHATFIRCTITNNSAGYGGGFEIQSGNQITLIDSTVCDNDPENILGSWNDGGGNAICGACCTNNICVQSGGDDCTFFGGQWHGEDEVCSDAVCPPGCIGDINGDYTVNVEDLLLLIAAWGTCP